MTFEGQDVGAPKGLRTPEFILRPIQAEDAELDYQAVMETKEFLRRWERDTWPEDDFTVEDNRQDMVKMQERHSRGESFGYTVMDPAESECFGCVYIFSPQAGWYSKSEPSALGSLQWDECDAIIFYWVRTSQMDAGLDLPLLQALIPWSQQAWPFTKPLFITNESLEPQIAALDATQLTRQFEIKTPDSDILDVAYA